MGGPKLVITAYTAQCSGAASGLRKFLAKVEISAGLLELVQALLPKFKTVFRFNFKKV